MKSTIEEFEHRRSLLDDITHNEARPRIAGLYEWLTSDEVAQGIICKLEQKINANALLENIQPRQPPNASTLEEVVAVGLLFMKMIQNGAEPWKLGSQFNIRSQYNDNTIQGDYDAVFNRFIDPALEFVARELQAIEDTDSKLNLALSKTSPALAYPFEIHESLRRFLKDHPDIRRNAFVMMQFGETKLHGKIIAAIRDTLAKYGIAAHRADDTQYHDDLFGNVLTYLHGCSFGIAVFERLEKDDFNPNVSLEVGYMRALDKSVCLLKDKTLNTLPTDLIGKLYKKFDPQDPVSSIPKELEKWLQDKDFIKI